MAMITLLALPFFSNGQIQHQTRHIDGWTLDVRTDRFEAATVCRLSKGAMRYGRQAVTFQFSARLNTSGAVYRIDGGAPVSVRSDVLELARLGFTLDADDLNNPSGGRVRIPETRLAGAHSVSIETRSNGQTVKFRLEGLQPALDAAKAAGCGPDSFN
jgi:hypothetical protein